MADPRAGDEELFEHTMRVFGERQARRANFGMQWEEVAELILPNYRNTFFYGNYNYPGEKKTYAQVDSTGMIALKRFAAIMDSLLTPEGEMWQKIGPTLNNKHLMRSRNAKLWFDHVTRHLFAARYDPRANFVGQNQNNYLLLGAFGNACMLIDEYWDRYLGRMDGIRYKSIPIGECFWSENHQGQVDSNIRWFRLTARQIWTKWFGAARHPEGFPEKLKVATEKGSEEPFDILHCVEPNDDFDASAIFSDRAKAFRSHYLCIASRTVLQRGGYYTFPYACPRYVQAPGETYGRGPAMDVLPAAKTLNSEKRVHLKVGHRQADPVLLVGDDGLLDMSTRPGATVKGGMNRDGRPLVGVLPEGKIQITQEMMNEEKALLNDAFLVSMFQILTEAPQMTATQVLERIAEKGILIAPEVGRQRTEYLLPMTDRELDILNRQRKLPKMPPELQRAGGEYHAEDRSPLGRIARAQASAGFLRLIAELTPVVNVTGDPSVLDTLDFDVAVPEMAEDFSVPERWMASPQKLAQKRQARAQAQQQRQQIEAMPSQAAMMKAQAVAQKGAQPQQPQPGMGPPMTPSPSIMGGQ